MVNVQHDGERVVEEHGEKLCQDVREHSRTSVFFFQAEDGIRDIGVTGVQTCALPISKDVARLRRWLEAHPAELDTLAPPRARRMLGLIHYDHPHYERSSSNIGDYTQTVALLGHVLRRRGLTVHTDDAELESALGTLRGAIAPELQLETAQAEVDLVPLSRDASRWEALPDPTWTIAFGWYMHPIFGVRTDLPFHCAIRPIFISFHVNKPEILTPEAVDYLKRYGPIGCRDWTTVDQIGRAS